MDISEYYICTCITKLFIHVLSLQEFDLFLNEVLRAILKAKWLYQDQSAVASQSSWHKTSKQRRINVEATSSRIDIDPTLFRSNVFVVLAHGPNKHGLVTCIQVNVYIGNTLSWLNGG